MGCGNEIRRWDADAIDRSRSGKSMAPDSETLDNGPEFTGKALDKWTYSRGVKLNCIRLGKPIGNAYTETFIGRLMDECLNGNWFLPLGDARKIIEIWRMDYNDDRPHASLRGLSPRECFKNRGRTIIAVGQ